MKLPTMKRLYKTDYKQEDQDLIDKLAYVLNQDIQVLYDALNNRVSLGDNIDCVVRTIEVTVDANGIPKSPTIFGITDQTRQIQGVEVQKASNLTNTSTYPSGGIFITFAQVQTGVQIQHVTGLQADNTYSLRIVGYY